MLELMNVDMATFLSFRFTELKFSSNPNKNVPLTTTPLQTPTLILSTSAVSFGTYFGNNLLRTLKVNERRRRERRKARRM